MRLAYLLKLTETVFHGPYLRVALKRAECFAGNWCIPPRSWAGRRSCYQVCCKVQTRNTRKWCPQNTHTSKSFLGPAPDLTPYFISTQAAASSFSHQICLPFLVKVRTIFEILLQEISICKFLNLQLAHMWKERGAGKEDGRNLISNSPWKW